MLSNTPAVKLKLAKEDAIFVAIAFVTNVTYHLLVNTESSMTWN
jgi:hypothetical protein